MTREELSARMSAIAKGPRGPQSPEHRAKIAASVRKAWAEGRKRPCVTDGMTPAERADYRTLRKDGGYTREEALRAIGREDDLSDA